MTTTRALCASAALLAAALLAPQAAAQAVCYGENTGPNFEDASSTGTAWFGIRFSPNVDVVVSRIEMFTGEGGGTHSVALWSHDAANDQPLASLGAGTWSLAPANDWQGADISPNVAVTSGQTYWLVWGTTGGSQSSIDLPMAVNGQPFRVSLDQGGSWGPLIESTDRHFKFRLICGCSGQAADYGAGCAGASGFVPHLNLDNCPAAGQQINVTVSQGLGGSTSLFLFGGGQGSLPIGGGCSLLLNPVLPLQVFVPLGGAGPGNGGVTVSGVLPVSASGVTFTMQVAVGDAASPVGFSMTNGIVVAVP